MKSTYPHIQALLENLAPDNLDGLKAWLRDVLNGEKTSQALMMSGEGTGKSVLLDDLIYPELEGGVAYVTKKDLENGFNLYAEKALIQIDDLSCLFSDGVKINNTISSLLSNKKIVINEKMKPLREVENKLNIIIKTGNSLPFKIEKKHRRYISINAKRRLDDLAREDFSMSAQEFRKKIAEEKDAFVSDLKKGK